MESILKPVNIEIKTIEIVCSNSFLSSVVSLYNKNLTLAPMNPPKPNTAFKAFTIYPIRTVLTKDIFKCNALAKITSYIDNTSIARPPLKKSTTNHTLLISFIE